MSLRTVVALVPTMRHLGLFLGKPELPPYGAYAKQGAPILKAESVPHEYSGWTIPVSMGVILIEEGIP